MPPHSCGGQKTAFRGQFSHPPQGGYFISSCGDPVGGDKPVQDCWMGKSLHQHLRIKVRSLGQPASLCLMSHLAGSESVFFKLQKLRWGGRGGDGMRGRNGMKWNRLENPCECQPGIALGPGLWDTNTTATCECCLCSTLALNIVTFVPTHFIFFILLNDFLMSVWNTEVHLINSTVLHPASAPCNLDELICQS